MNKFFLTFSWCLLTTLSSWGQLSMLVSDATGEKGQIVEVAVKVIGFEDIASMQFSVNWDSATLNFRAVENLSDDLPQFTDQQIGLAEAEMGAMRVAWFDNALRGITLSDSAQLFTLKFEVIAEGKTSNVSITNSPISIEFTGADSKVIEVENLIEGEVVSPGNTTSTNFLEAGNGMQLYQNEPNPFKTSTKITAFFSTIEPVKFFLTNISGKVIYQNNFKSIQGENTIAIESAYLSTPGTYYYTLETEQYRLSKKLILLP